MTELRRDGSGATLRFTRHGGAPVWGGWLFVCMGAGVLVLRHFRAGAEAPERLGLALVAGILGTAGALVVARRFRQTVTFHSRTGSLVIEDRTRFGYRRRSIRFDEIREIAVDEHADPDPDSRPFGTTTYQLVARLRDGSEVPVTDLVPGAASTEEARTEVVRFLERSSGRR